MMFVVTVDTHLFSIHSTSVSDIETIQGTLLAINSTVNTLTTSTASINASLQIIAMNISMASNSCLTLQSDPLINIDCSPLDPTVFSNGLGADFNAVDY